MPITIYPGTVKKRNSDGTYSDLVPGADVHASEIEGLQDIVGDGQLSGFTETDLTGAANELKNTLNSKYEKPSGGIPDSDIASAATWNAKGTYSKPSGGIPDSDIASASVWNAKGTYSKPSGGIPDSDIASASTWNGKANSPSALSLTLASGSWSSATPSTQTLSATGVTASNIVVVGFGSGITSAQYSAASAAKLACTAQAAGTITMTAFGTKPTVNIPLSVVILA
jgi:hypothetical protein